MHHDPSDLGSLIRIRITPKECTLRVNKYFRVKRVQQISDVKCGGVCHYSKQGQLGFQLVLLQVDIPVHCHHFH